MNRRKFIQTSGIVSIALTLAPSRVSSTALLNDQVGIRIEDPLSQEGVFQYINRKKGQFDLDLLRQIFGVANEFKEGDSILGIAADSNSSRSNARILIANTRLEEVSAQQVFVDELSLLIDNSTQKLGIFSGFSFGQLKQFLLEKSEEEILPHLATLTSDHIALVVKLMNNEELIQVSSKVFHPLPNSKVGSKGYMGARVQPNSPTDDPEDIFWQVMNAWSYGVGDVVLGNNPVSSNPNDVRRTEETLSDIIKTFGLESVIPHCVLSHIDIQAAIENEHPNSTGIWFQSLAGTVAANKTFDLTIDKMQTHAKNRNGQYGLYAETGQGADQTNGHAEGFDMVIHESRKYGFHRALKQQMNTKTNSPWVFVNDVAGFIGPEVFRTKEQLVRCCLEDLVMGKLHGLTIGLDICTTLHMDVSLDDLDWCIDQIMPANPGYLMALPTKNDPMLSYLTTSFVDHVRVREKFGFKVNDAMWDFFKKIQIIQPDNLPGEHFASPCWVYYNYCLAKGDKRSFDEINKEGNEAIERVRKRGVPISEGFGDQIWKLKPQLEKEVHHLYKDAKYCLWQELNTSFISAIPNVILLSTLSEDRKDYVYHPSSGEKLRPESIDEIIKLKQVYGSQLPQVQVVISDGLNTKSLEDEGHVLTFLPLLTKHLEDLGLSSSKYYPVIKNGRVRAGYQVGEVLFSSNQLTETKHILIHIIGERPGSEHRNFSVYITSASRKQWSSTGEIDHNITRVVSGISDTAMTPERLSYNQNL
jgi:ethanolamine ammonia-lyase large subunit